MANTNLSVVITASNAERTILDCVRSSLHVSDDVIVFLNNSEDDTENILNNTEVRVIHTPWLGYGATKNLAELHARYDFILSLDSDEVLDDTLISVLQTQQLSRNRIYSINRLTNYCGDWIRYSGWHPDWCHRIYHKDDARWSEDPVHENLIPTNDDITLERLDGLILHYSFSSMQQHLEKLERYAELKARGWMDSGNSPGWHRRLLGGSAKFFKSYFLKKGFLDGHSGWTIAKLDYYLVRRQIYYYDKMKNSQPRS